LIFKSRKPEAKAFRRWVTNEVLPSLRKTGQYQVTNYTLEENGQLALFPTNDSHVRNEVKRQMLDVALSTRSTKVRNLLRLLKPLVFTKTTEQL
jgi:prophage antirepressor-like protein